MKSYAILIVDDDPVEHEVLGDYLARAGFVLHHAYDGNEGLQKAAEVRPDLICLDVRMPGIDGFETLRRLRQSPGLDEIPVLFLSSVDSTHIKVKGLELGAEDYIPKPYEKVEVLARVRAALRRSFRYARTSGIMEGDLADISMAELLQTLEMGSKTARIQVMDQDASVTVAGGRLASVRLGALGGEQALQRLLIVSQGAFRVSFDVSLDASTKETGSPGQAIQGLLMDALVAQDEAIDGLDRVGGLDGSVLVREGADLPTWQDLPTGVTTIRTLLCFLEGDLRDAAGHIMAAHHRGDVVVV